MNLINHCLGTLEKAKIHNLLIAPICLVSCLHCSERSLGVAVLPSEALEDNQTSGTGLMKLWALQGYFPVTHSEYNWLNVWGHLRCAAGVTTRLILEESEVKLAPNAHGSQPSFEQLKVQPRSDARVKTRKQNWNTLLWFVLLSYRRSARFVTASRFAFVSGEWPHNTCDGAPPPNVQAIPLDNWPCFKTWRNCACQCISLCQREKVRELKDAPSEFSKGWQI